MSGRDADAPGTPRKAGATFTVALPAVAAVAWLFTERPLDWPAVPLACLELAVVGRLFPAARFDLQSPLTPMNWALFLFHTQLLVAPFLGAAYGFELATLPRLPSPGFINQALVLSAFAHLTFAVGAQLGAGRPGTAVPSPRFSHRFALTMAWLFVALGVAGLGLAFGGIGGYLRYVTDAEAGIAMQEAPTTLATALGTFLKPFLTFGLLWLWALPLQGRAPGRSYRLPTLLLLVTLLGVTASYNRASMVGPLLAVLAAYAARVERFSARTVALVGGAVLLAGVSFGAYRHQHRTGNADAQEAAQSLAEQTQAFLQVYGQGPQFLGFLLERTQDEELHLGRTLFASVAYPVPVLGKALREQSGVAYYNRLIYGTSGIVDQVIPASGELLLNFGLPGVAAFFALLGWVLRGLDDRFRRARGAFEAAACFYVATWVAFPLCGSVAVLSQICVYFLWPVYAHAAVRRALGAGRGLRPGHVPGPGALHVQLLGRVS